jgi:WD40 repeat protein
MTRSPISRLGVLPLALLLVAAGAAPADAQYFGRNKVQYETFDFQVLQTEHFDIYYYPEEREAALLAGRMAERWYVRLSRFLNHEMGGRQSLIMYANHAHFEQTNATPSNIDEGTGGFTELIKWRIVLPFAAGLEETDHVIGHELVHAFQFDVTGQGRSYLAGGVPGAFGLPLWFIEGMAEYLSVGPVDPNTAMWMRDATREKLPTILQMNDNYRWFPYRYGQALWSYLAGRYGDEIVGRLLKAAGRSNDHNVVLTRLLGGTPEELGAAWHERLHEAYDPLVDSTAAPADYGRPVFEEKEVLTIAPAVSADGRQLAFISSRDLFSVDAFIGDLETGKVVRKLTRTAVDPHFESLQSINSAGAWSPDGSTFAIAGISAGRPVLSLIDVASGDRKRTIELPQLGEIFTPAWSPDGRSMVFSALQGGLSDLFVYDLERDDLRRLTNDPYGDLHPSWSPDGRRIVFASDRLTTNLEQLEYGAYQLVLMDPTTRAVTPVPGFETGKHINPQWAPDGESIYFLSDRNGVTNLYRVYLGDGRLAQITNLYTGISGITPGSPALSVAQQTGRVVISIYTGGLYRMHVIDDPAVLAGEPVRPLFAGLEPARLPPADPITSQVSEMLADTRTGLPDTAEFLSKNYSAGLGLDYVGRPSLVFASDRYGTYFGAGAELYWSDMLGNRNLVTQLQVNGGLKDIAAVAGYTNRSRRLNWGVFAQQIPYINRFYNAGFVANPADSSIAFAEQIVTFRQTNRDLSGLVAYPLNRAQRLEFTLGFRDVRFDQELKTILSDPNSGQKIDEFEESQASFDPVTMGLGSAALVYDQSLFGATSPILGQRYRVELSPSLGSLNLINVLADYRRYIVPVRPFTIAARVVHYGRYLGDAQDQRLQPLFLGYPGMVRGYTDTSFEPRDCAASVDESCPLFNRLIGSRILMGNLELRFPLLGLLGFGSGYYGLLPIEVALFADAGLAWWSDLPETPDTDERPWFAGGDRRPVTSVGTSLRMNVFGYAIIEVSASRPFQRDRWIWQFGFVPGF